ncbi:MAG: DNA polymerase IV [Candidatus Thorarchaeota archaeon]
MNRIVFHCDLDCFFAAVEIRDNPEYKGKPVIIGADPKGGKGRGVVATCSYEARKFGLHSALPISKAYQLCPHGIYLQPNGIKYKEASKQVMEILSTFSKPFQQVSIDEAYLDLTEKCKDYEQAQKIAKKIQKEIFDKVGITLSIGCAPTKSIAKIASDFKKPNGITIVKPDEIRTFLYNMDITKISGIGKKTKKYYNDLGFYKIGDIIKTPLHIIIEKLGKYGKWVWEVANGLDNREVKEFNDQQKSISKERTFYEDTDDFNLILSKLEDINSKIHIYLEKHNIFYRTVTLKIRFEGFLTYTRSKSLSYPFRDRDKAMNIIINLYNDFKNLNKKVRLVGIKLSNLEEKGNKKQLSLNHFS